ncbi:hypothetical protein [Nonomuraea sp. NPDC049028]|uniref:hypothetical protein n=1 Tax=Nonomuraea sp. NPDC049028 TaxID=3364348 RepID=UPI00371C14A2
MTKAWTDAGFKNAVIAHGVGLGLDVEVVPRDPHTIGFAPLPKRWVAEQVFGMLMLHRRLARDYEALPTSSESMIYWSMTDNMTRRLTRPTTPTTPTWRQPSQTPT